MFPLRRKFNSLEGYLLVSPHERSSAFPSSAEPLPETCRLSFRGSSEMLLAGGVPTTDPHFLRTSFQVQSIIAPSLLFCEAARKEFPSYSTCPSQVPSNGFSVLVCLPLLQLPEKFRFGSLPVHFSFMPFAPPS